MEQLTIQQLLQSVESNTKTRLCNTPSKQTININNIEHLDYDMFSKYGLRPLTAPK